MELRIKKQKFFNNGELLLGTLTDAGGRPLQQAVTDWLEQSYAVTPTVRKRKGQGIDAKSLNQLLREEMEAKVPGMHKETHAEYGALFHDGINGFDFSLYDERYNLIRLRNSFIGKPGRLDGYKELLKLAPKLKKRQRAWKAEVESLGGSAGEDLMVSKQRLTVVGELQFGNWALVKHDLLRLLNSSDTVEIDYYIYITATDTLLDMLSDGVVSYERAIDAVTENRRIIKTPMWIIGLDCI